MSRSVLLSQKMHVRKMFFCNTECRFASLNPTLEQKPFNKKMFLILVDIEMTTGEDHTRSCVSLGVPLR
jgi:hypothetical protein